MTRPDADFSQMALAKTATRERLRTASRNVLGPVDLPELTMVHKLGCLCAKTDLYCPVHTPTSTAGATYRPGDLTLHGKDPA